MSIVREEERRRVALLPDDNPDAAYDIYNFTDAPFISEFCLIFLVALNHHIERRCPVFGALAVDNGRPLSRADYQQRLGALERKGWEEVKRRLGLSHCAHHSTMKVLRLLANAYKHDAGQQPSQKLLNSLGLDPGHNYAELPQSGAVWSGLAAKVGLPATAGYCDIAESFVDQTEQFLNDVQTRNMLSRITSSPVSLLPQHALR